MHERPSVAVPTLISNADGTIAEANDAALTLLRATLEQLRELPPGALSPQPPDPNASEAFREEWERQGSPDVGGEGTVRRLDGTTVRVKFGITPMDDGRFLVLLEEVAAVIDAPPVLYTAGQVLAELRAAERRLAAIPEGSDEWRSVSEEIDAFRRRYHALFDQRGGAA
jgi:PAS domain-containing protein